MFGNQFIYECGKVSFKLDPQQKKIKVQNFINTIEATYENYDLAYFIHQNQDSFFTNTVSSDRWEHQGVKPGMKLIKAFKFFESNKEALYQLQSEASRIIQEDKIEGTLCFSVHPLDFLSLSCNAHKWRSCHSLDGEYRGGNLSYMVDHTTCICYIKSDDDTHIANFPADIPWNSKKWRVLLYFNEDDSMIFAGKQYPFGSQEGMNYIRDIITNYFKRGNWHEWEQVFDSFTSPTTDNTFYCDEQYALYGGRRIVKLNDLVKDAEGSLQFNDVLHSSSYEPIYIGNTSLLFESNIAPIIVGGTVKCLRCGEELVTHHEVMCCDTCEQQEGSVGSNLYQECSCCGARVSSELMRYDVNNEPACPRCVEQYYCFCEECGDLCHVDNRKYDRETNQYLCYLCYEEGK